MRSDKVAELGAAHTEFDAALSAEASKRYAKLHNQLEAATAAEAESEEQQWRAIGQELHDHFQSRMVRPQGPTLLSAVRLGALRLVCVACMCLAFGMILSQPCQREIVSLAPCGAV